MRSQDLALSVDCLESILRVLGQRLLEWRGTGAVAGRWEGSQLKSEADVRAHAFISAELAAHWPGIPLVSEEDPLSHSRTRPSRYWIVDPIDGTASYCGGFSGFVTQVALIEDRQPLFGVVHAPALELTFRGISGSPSLRNGTPVVVAANPDRWTLIDNYPEPRGIARHLFEALPASRYVECGSIALKICRVADGTADLFVKDVVVRDWDLAPAHLVLQGAGGILVGLDGEPISYCGDFEKHGLIAATSRRLVDATLAVCNNAQVPH